MSERYGFAKVYGPNKSFKGAQLYLPKPVQEILGIKHDDVFLWHIETQGNKIVVVFEKVKEPTKIIKVVG